MDRIPRPHFIFTRKKKESGFSQFPFPIPSSPFPFLGVTMNFTLPFSGATAFTYTLSELKPTHPSPTFQHLLSHSHTSPLETYNNPNNTTLEICNNKQFDTSSTSFDNLLNSKDTEIGYKFIRGNVRRVEKKSHPTPLYVYVYLTTNFFHFIFTRKKKVADAPKKLRFEEKIRL